MFWRMTGVSSVDTILDKENFTLEELLDEDDTIQECRGLNNRLINFLRERVQIEQLVRYIVEKAPEDAENGRAFKYPFVACEIFTLEVDLILQTLVEDEELMNLLFSFLEPEHPHGALLAGYFSKVVGCLLLRKSSPLMNYIQARPDIIQKLVDLLGISSIKEVLIRLVGADELLYTSFSESTTQWLLEDIDVLEMIVTKFSSSDCPHVHGNVAESLCAICKFAPAGLSAKVSSPSFIARLFHHALGDPQRPKSVIVNVLTVCICLLDPNKHSSDYIYGTRQLSHVTAVTINPEIVEAMLECLGNLSKLLDISADENVLPTTYGNLQPPFGRHRLKIVEFITMLMSVRTEATEKELIRLGLLKRIVELFFEYPYNNFIHHNAEKIIVCCLESNTASLVEHILEDCNLVKNILDAEKNTDKKNDMVTVVTEGRKPPKLGNVGHITRIANKLIQLGATNTYIQAHLQDNSEWTEWHENVLESRNALENVLQWACGRPSPLHYKERDSDDDDDDYHDKDYDVAGLSNDLSQAFTNQAQVSLEGQDENMYFVDDSAEVVVTSLQLGDNQESGSLFTNSNWFSNDEEKAVAEPSTSDAATTTVEAAPGGSTPENDDSSSSTNETTPDETGQPVDQQDSGETGGTTTTEPPMVETDEVAAEPLVETSSTSGGQEEK